MVKGHRYTEETLDASNCADYRSHCALDKGEVTKGMIPPMSVKINIATDYVMVI